MRARHIDAAAPDGAGAGYEINTLVGSHNRVSVQVQNQRGCGFNIKIIFQRNISAQLDGAAVVDRRP